jgi:hypothetical protein
MHPIFVPKSATLVTVTSWGGRSRSLSTTAASVIVLLCQ